jgi:ketosteroid isomerase-like protein
MRVILTCVIVNRNREEKSMFRITLLASSALLAAAICIASSGPATAQNADAYVTSYIKALNASMPPSGDPDVVANAFAENGVHQGMNQGPQQVGREQIRQFFAGFKNYWSDWTQIEKTRLVQGNRAAWEGTAEGHHKESGKYVKLPIVFFLDFDDQGKAREVRVYVDVHLIDEQTK